MGRKSKLTVERIDMAIRLREDGYSLEKIAEYIGVDKSTLYIREDWGQLRKELNDVKKIKEMEELERVKKALSMVTGKYKLKTKTTYKDADNNITQIVEKVEEKAPSDKMLEFYLKNKAGDEFNKSDNNEMGSDADGALNIHITGDE